VPPCPVLSGSSAMRHVSRHWTLNSIQPAFDARPSDAPVQPSNCAAPKVSHRTRPVTPEPASSDSASDAVENRCFTSTKTLNPASQARQEGERNPNPSLPFKLHLLRKYANTTKCSPTCVSVLAFLQSFSRCYVSPLLDPNAYAQDDDLVALDSRANYDCPS
jgi:hypothetical protein